MGKLYIIVAGALLWVTLLVNVSHAAGFKSYEQKLEGRILDVKAACLSKDAGGKQLLINQRLGSYPDYRAKLTVLAPTGGKQAKSWSTLAELEFSEANQPLGVDFVGSCDERERQSLLLIYQDRLVPYELRKGRLQPLRAITYPPAAFAVENGRLPFVDWLRDFDGSGNADLLYPAMNPTTKELSLLLIQDILTAAKPPVHLDYRLKSFLRTMPEHQPFAFHFLARNSLWIPEVFFCDYNGDGRRDICLPWHDELTIFLQDDKSGFAGEQNKISRQFGLLTEEERSKPASYAITLLGRLGSDAYSDVLINQFSGLVTSAKTVSNIYQRTEAGEEKVILKPPKGKSSGFLLADINGDGIDDLVSASAQSGILAAVKALLNGTVDVRFHFYVTGKDGKLPKKPDFKRELGFKFDIKSFTPQGFLPNLAGDFNGDGLPDALYGKDKNSLYLILQRPGKFYPKKITYKGKYRVSEKLVIDDITGDALSDLVFWYRDWSRLGELLILENSGNWKTTTSDGQGP